MGKPRSVLSILLISTLLIHSLTSMAAASGFLVWDVIERNMEARPKFDLWGLSEGRVVKASCEPGSIRFWNAAIWPDQFTPNHTLCAAFAWIFGG
jgi:hypothetical protein